MLTTPAGFGKTTLVIDWVREQVQPVAWLTLDEQDNDPVLFWRYLISALQEVNRGLGQRALAFLVPFPGHALETAVTILINDIISYTAGDKTVTLVLDDFHWIHSAVVHQSFNYLLQNQPSQLNLVLVSRAEPPLPLARLRVEGRLVELRTADLRLTQSEISSFITEVMALEVSSADLQLLAEQLEGWAAGMQLAALSLRERDPAGAVQFMQSFAGVRQHIFAYLMEEVLRYQSSEVRQFLQQTAVLRQFCASLCTAVTENHDAAQILRQLVAGNLFITPLDDIGQWYRYHPLFAEFLRNNLNETLLCECHRRAAAWYFDQGLFQDAMRNALAAADYNMLSGLLTQTYKKFLADGLLVSLQKWLSYLPPNYHSPQLRLAAAWCRVYEMGEPELAQIVADIADRSTGDGDPSFQGEILAVRAVYASLYGHINQGIELANKALALIDKADFLSLAAAYQALGNAYRNQGELDAAIKAYTEGHRQFVALGNVIMAQLPLYRIASIRVMQGRLHQAWRLYETLRENAHAAGYEPLIMAGEVFGYLSDLFLEWHDLEQAIAFARQEIELAMSGHMLLGLVDGYLKLAAVCAAQGNEHEARKALSLAEESAVPLRSVLITSQVAMHQARHALSWGNLRAAAVWANDYVERRNGDETLLTPLLAQTADLLLARVWLAQGRIETALGLLEEIIPVLDSGGRVRRMTEALVLQSLGHAAQGQEKVAREILIQALELAKPESYVRVFVENGQLLTPLLYQVRQQFPDYVTQLLNTMPLGTDPVPPGAYLLDPLTEREQEIVCLIGYGYTNRQIADHLFISVGTVKGHVNHIFSKLDVSNRTQALLRARELNLIN